MMQIRTQQSLLGQARGQIERGGSVKHCVAALMDHHEAVPGVASVDNITRCDPATGMVAHGRFSATTWPRCAGPGARSGWP
jgi:hypothetical protein